MNELPRGYISYSAYKLWKTNKDAFRRHYYEGVKSPETPETIYGNKIGKMLEENHKDFAHIPRFSSPEHEIDILVRGCKVMGRLDSFDPDTCEFLDYKTGHANKEGKAPWDNVKVAKLEQLPFYSMLVKEKYGKVKDECSLVWLETEFEKKTQEFDGRTLPQIGHSKVLLLTGKVVVFRRIIKEWERKKIKTDVLVVIVQIKKDYEEYKANRERTHAQNAEVVSPIESANQEAISGHAA